MVALQTFILLLALTAFFFTLKIDLNESIEKIEYELGAKIMLSFFQAMLSFLIMLMTTLFLKGIY